MILGFEKANHDVTSVQLTEAIESMPLLRGISGRMYETQAYRDDLSLSLASETISPSIQKRLCTFAVNILLPHVPFRLPAPRNYGVATLTTYAAINV
jgi:hypothetical protein